MRAAIACLAFAIPLVAGRIDVTNEPLVKLHYGAQLDIEFSVASYAHHNPGYPPYPTVLGLLAVAQYPTGHALATAPGTTAAYFPGFLFHGWLESLDGSLSVPFMDAHATWLGLPEGSLLVAPGTVTIGGGTPWEAAVIGGSVYLSIETAESLFAGGTLARIKLRSAGEDLTFGLGPGYTMRQAISEPGLRGLGPVETAGLTRTVLYENPESASFVLMGLGLVLLAALGRHAMRRRAARAPAAATRSRS